MRSVKKVHCYMPIQGEIRGLVLDTQVQRYTQNFTYTVFWVIHKLSMSDSSVLCQKLQCLTQFSVKNICFLLGTGVSINIKH